MNEYLFVLHCFNNDKGGKKCLFMFRMDTTPCPHVFQFTIGRIMDAVLADTGPAVSFERTKAKSHSRKRLVQGHTGSKCPGFASLLRFQACLFFNSASYPPTDGPFLHTWCQELEPAWRKVLGRQNKQTS